MPRKTPIHIFEFSDETCKNCGFDFKVAFYDKAPNILTRCTNCGWQYLLSRVENAGWMSITKSLGFEELERTNEEIKHDNAYIDLRAKYLSELDPLNFNFLDEQERIPIEEWGIPDSFWKWEEGEKRYWHCGKKNTDILVSDNFPQCRKKTFDKAFKCLLDGRAITRESATRDRTPWFYIIIDDEKEGHQLKQIDGTQICFPDFSNEDFMADDWILCDNWLALIGIEWNPKDKRRK